VTSAIARLNDFGQSPWYDNLSRTVLADGTLAALIADDAVRGVTSNPTILEKAIASGDDAYVDDFTAAVHAGVAVDEMYWRLVIPDIQHAADRLRPAYDATGGADGFVSLEVPPDVAHDTEATVNQARDLFARVDRANVMIKIPATREGLPAITRTAAAGINVNVTLIFSLERYEAVIDAYLEGVRQLVAGGGSPAGVASVASFFVSRVDTETDRRLAEGHPLRGRAAVANARLAYERFRTRFAGPEWTPLAAAGARLQRPLWASTSTKNPAYPSTLYVDELIGRDTVNTLAPASIDALHAGDGHQEADTITRDVAGAHATIAALADAGVDFADVTATLEREGVDAFAQSFRDALATLEKRSAEV
jgi:transaldolase